MGFLSWWGSPAGITVTWLVVVDFFIRIVALGFVPRGRRPSAALAWLALIFAVPIVGGIIFLLFGKSRLRGHRADLEHRMARLLQHSTADEGHASCVPDVPPAIRAAVTLNRHNGATPLVSGNGLDLYPDYEASIEAMTRAVDHASEFVHAQFYILAVDRSTDRFFTALERAHARGVTVRVLVDHVGSVGFPGYKAALARMESAGIQWRRMLPAAPPRFHYQRPDLRNHRKILVVDNEVGFTGSQNMIDSSYNKKRNRRKNFTWIDLMVRLVGPMVQHLNTVFMSDWTAESDPEVLQPHQENAGARTPIRATDAAADGSCCQLLPSGPGLDNSNNLRLFNQLIYGAQERVVICSPYLVPDESLLIALTSAAQRGIRVDVHLGATSDHPLTHHAQRSYYEGFLRAGINIHLYREPYVLHSKFVLVDGMTAVIASSNMDIRSFELNQEINLLVIDHRIVRELEDIAAEYGAESRQLDLVEWRARPIHQKFLDNACRLTANLQ